jgi:hypothetical protein
MATFPGELVIVAILEYATKCRETMSAENRDKLDALNIKAIEKWQGFWEGLAK